MSTRGQNWRPSDINGLGFGIKDLVRIGEGLDGGRGPQDRPAGTCRSGLTGATSASMNAAVGSQDWCVRFWMGDIVMLSAGRIWRPEMVRRSAANGTIGGVGMGGLAATLRLVVAWCDDE